MKNAVAEISVNPSLIARGAKIANIANITIVAIVAIVALSCTPMAPSVSKIGPSNGKKAEDSLSVSDRVRLDRVTSFETSGRSPEDLALDLVQDSPFTIRAYNIRTREYEIAKSCLFLNSNYSAALSAPEIALVLGETKLSTSEKIDPTREILSRLKSLVAVSVYRNYRFCVYRGVYGIWKHLSENKSLEALFFLGQANNGKILTPGTREEISADDIPLFQTANLKLLVFSSADISENKDQWLNRFSNSRALKSNSSSQHFSSLNQSINQSIDQLSSDGPALIIEGVMGENPAATIDSIDKQIEEAGGTFYFSEHALR